VSDKKLANEAKKEYNWAMKLPKKIAKYFWGDNLEELNWKGHRDYITKTILEKGDLEALEWLFGKTDRNYLKKIAKKEKFEAKSKNFWNFYLS